MPIRLFDSLTREIKPLGERETGAPPVSAANPFTFYNCGPTVYAPAHIGNFRTFVINDVLRRLLELEFGPDKVRHVRNLTDVDDRTIAQAKKEGRPLAEITKKWTDKFHADCDALNCLRPHVEPTATGHIREQVDMIDVLMKKGNAYRAPDGSVYFKISSFVDGTGKPAYGRLSRVNERELKVTDSAFDSDHKNNVGDFALWKAYKPEEDGDVKWPGPDDAAAGRPGWHIECSAMIKKHLGETIDLHTGGVDLLFPHHENEIAQSECCNGTTFSRHWYHSEFLQVDAKKMSKSVGNIYTLDDLTQKYDTMPMAVRYALLAGHPRKQLNFGIDVLHAATAELELFRKIVKRFLEIAEITTNDFENYYQQPTLSKWVVAGEAYDALRDDLNVPLARGLFFKRIAEYQISPQEKPDAYRPLVADLSRFMFALGLRLFENGSTEIPISATTLAEKRWAAKQAKDFATADALRKELAAAGWAMLDGKDGYKLEPLKKQP